jgi:hypothetical protein
MSKSKKRTNRLSFTAETLRPLNSDDLGAINGGRKHEDDDRPGILENTANCGAMYTTSRC